MSRFLNANGNSDATPNLLRASQAKGRPRRIGNIVRVCQSIQMIFIYEMGL
jgi:hypothetical protein